jgi:hypothetical protein
MEAWSCVTIISQYTAWKCDMKWKHLFRLKIDDELWPLEKNNQNRKYHSPIELCRGHAYTFKVDNNILPC